VVVLIENVKDVYLNLPPLVFAILYDKVTTLGIPTSESPWTISRLTPTLSSLSPAYLAQTPDIPFSTLPPLKQLKIALFRRVLTYPLYRSLALAEKVWGHSVQVVRGKRSLVRVLLEAREICMEGEWSVYGRIMIEDYVIWAQGCRERVLEVLAGEMEKVVVDEGELGFDLFVN